MVRRAACQARTRCLWTPCTPSTTWHTNAKNRSVYHVVNDPGRDDLDRHPLILQKHIEVRA